MELLAMCARVVGAVVDAGTEPYIVPAACVLVLGTCEVVGAFGW